MFSLLVYLITHPNLTAAVTMKEANLKARSRSYRQSRTRFLFFLCGVFAIHLRRLEEGAGCKQRTTEMKPAATAVRVTGKSTRGPSPRLLTLWRSATFWRTRVHMVAPMSRGGCGSRGGRPTVSPVGKLAWAVRKLSGAQSGNGQRTFFCFIYIYIWKKCDEWIVIKKQEIK